MWNFFKWGVKIGERRAEELSRGEEKKPVQPKKTTWDGIYATFFLSPHTSWISYIAFRQFSEEGTKRLGLKSGRERRGKREREMGRVENLGDTALPPSLPPLNTHLHTPTPRQMCLATAICMRVCVLHCMAGRVHTHTHAQHTVCQCVYSIRETFLRVLH